MADERLPVDWEALAELPPLPSKDDKLFTTAEDWWNNACLNYSRDGWTLYALGYKDAADLLVSHIEDGGRRQDTLVYPILFLYRQYLELALKELIRDARILEDIDEPFPKTHLIDELWRIAQALLQQLSSDEPIDYLEEIGRLIGEFSKVDPTSMAFRYPEDRDGNPSLLGISHINLRNVKEVIGKIAIILDGASTHIDVYLSYKADKYRDFYSSQY
jgi:hypothetical protein